MKKILTLLVLTFSISVFAQSSMKITQKFRIPKKGYYLQLANVFDDSRCPENVNCIWAGEVSVTVKVYKDKKFIEETILTFNATNRDKNIKWFEKYFSKKIKGIGVLPAPKEGVEIKPKNQYLKIIFTD